ncbi:MAG TPA: hypothetical protein PKD80_02690, partial [Microthrixaceae bacterium]|nr:hypothetical protein [Microthrixaceae bacterium]
ARSAPSASPRRIVTTSAPVRRRMPLACGVCPPSGDPSASRTHAIETAGGHGLRHGEAVAIGLIYAAEVACRLGRIDAAAVAEHRRVVGGYDLPTTVPPELTDDEVVELFARDKKATREVTFVLDGPDGVEVVGGIAEALLRDALAALR